MDLVNLLVGVPVIATASTGRDSTVAIAWLPAAPTVLLAGGAALLGIVALVGWLTQQLASQNGRLLLRLEALEAARADPTSVAAPGLAVGDPVPDFIVPDLDGNPVSKTSLLAAGHPLLLITVDPRCGPCYTLLPDIGGWQRVYGGHLTVALVSGGTPETNQAMTAEYGIESRLVLVQHDKELFESFGLVQMPSAFLVGQDGMVQRTAVYGAQAVRQLVADSLGLELPPPPARPIEPAGNQSVAPVFRRPDIEGNPREVGVARGRDTLLLFWDPGCPYCEQLLPEVREWEAQTVRPDIMVVSRGPVGLNRELGLVSPIVLDDDREIGRTYGTTGTPAAIVIDRHGVVIPGVGRGVSGVRDLVRDRFGIGPAGDTGTRPPGNEKGQGT